MSNFRTKDRTVDPDAPVAGETKWFSKAGGAFVRIPNGDVIQLAGGVRRQVVADILDPSTELAPLSGVAPGDLIIAVELRVSLDDFYTIYAWDDDVGGAAVPPLTVDGTGGRWIAIGGSANANPGPVGHGVQARRTTAFGLSVVFADVTLDTTDVETDSTVLDHDLGTADDNINVGVTGCYLITYSVWGNRDSDAAEARVRISNTLIIPGSEQTDGTGTHNQTHNYFIGHTFIANLTAGQFITLQLRRTGGAIVSAMPDIMLTATLLRMG